MLPFAELNDFGKETNLNEAKFMAAKKLKPGDFNDDTLFEFKNSGTRDYIASRVLLLNGFAGQGSVLAVTSIEKTLKTILIKMGESFRADGKGHNLNNLIDSIKAIEGNYFTMEEEDFIKNLNNSYRIRYFISEEEDLVLFLPSSRILLKLDMLYCGLIKKEPLLSISEGSKLFDMYEKGHMPRSQLLEKNAYFNPLLSDTLESEVQWCDKYEHIKNGKTFSQKFKPFKGGLISNMWQAPPEYLK